MKADIYKCPDCESHSSSEGLVCPVHGKELEKVSERASGCRFRQVGEVWVQSGLSMVIPEGQIDRDNDNMVSLAMGCPDPVKQKEYLKLYNSNGVKGARFHPKTGQLHFRGGRTTQRKLMQLNDLHDNN